MFSAFTIAPSRAQALVSPSAAAFCRSIASTSLHMRAALDHHRERHERCRQLLAGFDVALFDRLALLSVLLAFPPVAVLAVNEIGDEDAEAAVLHKRSNEPGAVNAHLVLSGYAIGATYWLLPACFQGSKLRRGRA